MPEQVFDYYGPNLSPMIAAWTAHLVARGCHPETARRKANDRVHRKRTWPPQGRPSATDDGAK